MMILENLISIFERIASVAKGVQRVLSVFLIFALGACGYLAFIAYSGDSSLWWNSVKVLLVCLPAIIWLIIWFVLGQLKQTPETVQNLMQDKDRVLQHFTNLDLDEAKSMRGAYKTLSTLTQQDGLEEVMETISGVGLIISPLFAILAFLAFWCLCGLMLLALIVMMF